MRSIDGFSQIVLKNRFSHVSKEAQNYLRLIRENAAQMGRLIDDLLAFSRLGRRPLTKHPVETEGIVDQVVAEEDRREKLSGKRTVRFSLARARLRTRP